MTAVWAANGRELFYRNGDKMMVVPIEMKPSFTAGSPRVLFEGRYFFAGHDYDVSPAGDRFYLIQEGPRPHRDPRHPELAAIGPHNPSPITDGSQPEKGVREKGVRSHRRKKRDQVSSREVRGVVPAQPPQWKSPFVPGNGDRQASAAALSASSRYIAAPTSPRWVNACAKLPRYRACRSSSSAYSPT